MVKLDNPTLNLVGLLIATSIVFFSLHWIFMLFHMDIISSYNCPHPLKSDTA